MTVYRWLSVEQFRNTIDLSLIGAATFQKICNFSELFSTVLYQNLLTFSLAATKIYEVVRSILLCRFSGKPFRQKISFNADVAFSKIDQQIDSRIESIIENESRLQNLQCLTTNMNVCNPEFSNNHVENFRVLARPEVSFWPKFENL